MDRLLLTAAEVAEVLGTGRSTVFELIAARRLRSVKIGASRRVPVDAVHEYLDRLVDDARGLSRAACGGSARER